MKKARIAVAALAVLMLFAAVSCKEPHVHEFGEWKTTKEATCTEAGVETRTCKGEGCTEKETREIPKLDHEFIDKVEERYLKFAATEDSPAVYYKSCKVCGEKSEDKTFLDGEHKHTYATTWTTDAENHWHECTGEDCEKTSDVAEHILVDKRDDAHHWKECAVCGYKVDEVAHSYGTPYFNGDNVVQLCDCGASKTGVAVGSEEALKKAIEDGVANIYLSADIKLSDTIIVGEAKKIVLNLNGKSLFNTEDIWNEETGSWSLVSVRDTAELTITGDGSLKAKENDAYAADLYDEGAKLIIESGEFVGNIHSVYVLKGSLVVNGGKYSVQQKFPNPEKADEFVLNCYDSSYADKTAKIVVFGGTFANFNPADCAAEGANTNFLAEGYKTTSKDVDGITWWTVEKN